MFKSKEVIIKKINWEKDYCDICFGDEFRKDEEWFMVDLEAMFTTHNWKNILKKKQYLRIWTFQMTRVMGIEWWHTKEQLYKPVWVAGNDF